MTRRIHVLPDHVANRIAAGEVVERPASVVKELVENAIDAGARRIEIQIESGGKRRIRVSDDGSGMAREDALLALERHATSKISRAEDLARIATLGFRGEALPSIAAVSRLTLETQEEGEGVGTRIRARAGSIEGVDPHARSRGTTVEVERLFLNAPARAQFLRSAPAEARAVSAVVARAAVSRPRIGFRLLSERNVLLDLPPVEELTDRLRALWGDGADDLIQVRGAETGLSVDGYVQRPDATRPGFRRSVLLADGRPFRDGGLVEAVDRGYRTTIPPSHRPWLFLSILSGDGGVDPNVHPSKEEVRFRDRARLERLVERVVQEALDTVESSASFTPGSREPALSVRERAGPPAGGAPGAGRHSKAPAAQQTTLFVARPEPGDADSPTEPDGAPVPPSPLRVWQLHRTWILAEVGDGLLLIDQHSAHERILYHRILGALEDAGLEGQRLLIPFNIRLTRGEFTQVEAIAGMLRRTGYEVEGFGGDTIAVHAVPDPHPWFDAERCLREMLAELEEGSDLTRAARNQHDRIAMTFACKGAIKAGLELSEDEMRELVDRLFATPLPFHDVHGRPTIVRLTRAELERKFGRH